MDVNFWGTVYGSRVACQHLGQRGGALINVGSVVGERAAPLQGIYSASKYAIKGWTEALRTELQSDDVPISVTLIKRAVDWFMARVFVPATHSHRPPHGRATLYEAGEDLRERGNPPGWARPSLSTSMVTHPAITRPVLIGAAAGLALLVRARRQRVDRDRHHPAI
jgi:NAD(P)-dependent dehydrogenase (short-subunit alcohol dehydrogenase family)